MFSRVLPLTLFLCISLVQAAQEVVIKATDVDQVLFTPAGTAGWEYSGPSSSTDCGGDYRYSMNNNSELTVTFTGVAFSLNLIRFSTGARAQIDLDGVPLTTVDTFSSVTDCNTPVVTRTGLSNTSHRLRVSDATHDTVRRWIRFKSLTYTGTEPAAFSSSVSIASASSASVASASSASLAAATEAAKRREGKARTGRIAGGAAGGIIGFLLVATIVWSLLRRKGKAAPSTPVEVQPIIHYEQQPGFTPWAQQPSTAYSAPSPYLTPGPTPHPSMGMGSQSTGHTNTSEGSPPTFVSHPGYPMGAHPPQGYVPPMPQYPQPMQGATQMPMTQQQQYPQPVSQPPQPMYGDRPMSQYAVQGNGPVPMAPNMNGMQASNQYGAPPTVMVAEPMEVYSNARHASGVPSGYNQHQVSQLPGNPNSGGLGLHTSKLPQPM